MLFRSVDLGEKRCRGEEIVSPLVDEGKDKEFEIKEIFDWGQ